MLKQTALIRAVITRACGRGEKVGLFGKIFKNFALRLLGVVFGGIIYYIVISIVLKLGLNANDLKLLSACVVALFLGLPYWKSKLSHKKAKKEKKGEKVNA